MFGQKSGNDGKGADVKDRRGSDFNQAAKVSGSAPSAAPSISLPKGGGAIRGMGEKFAANPVSGAGSMTVPIAVTPGRSGFSPKLSCSYDSGSGNGPFGLGWNLSLPAITRKTDKGLPKYQDADESDVFILSGAEDLVPALIRDGDEWRPDVSDRMADGASYRIRRYRPRVEGLFARIERWTNLDTGETHWRSISKDDVATLYGKTAESRIADPEDPRRVFSWLICESRDDKGNAIVYEYKPEDSSNIDLAQAHERNRAVEGRSTNRFLKRIKYGNRTSHLIRPDLSQTDWLFEVVFDYGEGHYEETPPDANAPQFALASVNGTRDWPARNDPFSTFRASFEVRTYRLCRRVLMFHHFPEELGADDYLVRSTEFEYEETPIASIITSVTQSGYVRQDDGAYLKKSLPPLEFGYSKAEIQSEIHEVDPVSLENLPYGLDGARYQWVDLDGEGVSGILTEQAEGWFYKPNLGGARFGPVQLISSKPSTADLNGAQQLIDLAGDGQLDLAQFAPPLSGFYERGHDGGWSDFRPFTSIPEIDWNSPYHRYIDLTGDGHADILATEDGIFTWYQSSAEEGFGRGERVPQSFDEERGPRLVFAEVMQTIFLADMSGDGLTDLVRIRNGEVCYWPNLGYGRFGARVTMDDSPWFDAPDLFDPSRIRLADIDGSGVTDIIYLGRDEIRLYFNQSGNSWSEARALDQFPRTDNLSSVTAVDLLGNGTACLVWSSPLPGDASRPMRYVDLMGGQKPHLMVEVKNNLGAETRSHYAASTKFYLADKAAGKPWVTRLPFPVHTVERVETIDRISRNRFVTSYKYHHGYFDGIEREFRGFGMVEQQDTEEFAALRPDDALSEPTNIDAASHVPPVITRTWFHTGVYFGRDHVSDFFAGLLDDRDTGEYYREPGLSDGQARRLLLEDTTLPEGLTAEEEREACRALKGSILRQEVYAADGTAKAEHPYTVSERNYALRRIQPRGSNQYAVFLAHPRETIDSHYERNPADPRISHALTLEVDEFGNVLKSAAVGYGRRQSDPNLPTQEDRDKQTATLVTYTENDFTNLVDNVAARRAPLPSESRTYELTGYTPSGPAGRFQVSDFAQPDQNGRLTSVFDDEIEYEEPLGNGKQRRLIERVRTYYRPDDLGGAQNDAMALLPLGELERLALPGESYKLAFTPGLLTNVFQRPRPGQQPENLLPVPASVLQADVPGGQVTDRGGYVDLDGDDHWWVPSGRAFYSSDAGDDAAAELAQAAQHFFLPRRFRDPFGVTTSVTNDAYDLMPQETRDALDNRVTVGERNVDPAQPLVRHGHDYRVLRPALVMDANRNRSAVAFDALGMVVGTAVMGKPEDNPQRGDSLVGFIPDLTDSVISAHMQDPLAAPHDILQGGATRLVYDLFAYYRTKDQPDPQPAVVYSLARETHHADLPPGRQTKIQPSFSYSDGFGREIQKKIQAEPGPVPMRDAEGKIIIGADGQPQMTPNDASPRWVGGGWTIFNNKGKPVRQYEPFFTDRHRFEFDARIGVSPVLFYDPVERGIATLRSNHTWEKVVFDPWRQETWDVNDTVSAPDPKTDADVGHLFSRLAGADYLPTWHALRTDAANADAFAARYPNPTDRANETMAARKTEVHAATPTVAHADSLGRAFLTVAHNKFKYSDTSAADPPVEELHRARVILDIEGNRREVRDERVNSLGGAEQRAVMRYDYDMLGNRIHQTGMEAGDLWSLNDVTGHSIREWDSRGHSSRAAYDRLRRLTHFHLREGAAAELLVERNAYGEAQPNPETNNLRGKVVQVFDQAGVVTNNEYDFKGNLLGSRRQLAVEYKATLNWSAATPLEATTYASGARYDALNRPTEMTAPDNSVIRPAYNEANLLERVEINLRGAAVATTFINDIAYNAKGQRQMIEYRVKDDSGADQIVRTRYGYDPDTFRLTRLNTERPHFPAGERLLQDLHYIYDPVGNITYIRDDAQQTIFFRNRRVEPSAEYAYDAIYRLIEATGREHLGQTGGQPDPPTAPDAFNGFHTRLDHPGDGNAMGTYIERYAYDEVGNILSTRHRGSDPAHPGWTRRYEYDEASLIEPAKQSNRLSRAPLDSDPPSTAKHFDYDSHGNTTRMPHLPLMQWDYRDQLQATAQQVVNNGSPETTWYVYDSGGQRVRKVTDRQSAAGTLPTRMKERIYLGGFEIYREYENNGETVNLERETLHIMDDRQRVALVETRTQGNDGSPAQLTRFQFGNHLGSASLEVDGEAQIISYEEYFPYGSTSYQAVRSAAEAPKRYRYTGKERDEESGLYHHGVRHYAAWLGRWTSCDPAGLRDGANLYKYVAGNPTLLIDPSGSEGETPPPNNPKDVAQFEATQAAFEAGKKLERGEVKATRGGKELPPPRGKQLEKLSGGSQSAKELRLKYATKQGIEAGQALKENVATRSAAAAAGSKDIAHFGEASQKLVPEVAFDKGKVISVNKNPGGEPEGARTADLAIAKKPTPPAEYESLQGNKGSAEFESAADLKLGAGRIPDKPGFTKASGGLEAEELTPGTKGLSLPKGTGTALNAVGGALIVYDALKFGRELNIKDQGYAGRAGSAVLQDENGEYTLQIKEGLIFNDYSKTYISGPLKDTTVELGFFEFLGELRKRNKKYGGYDLSGDYVPGEVEPIFILPPQNGA
jgi:RHS repeat-associated protein